MSRSGYTGDIDNWDLIKYRGQVASAIRGKRGQKFLRELIAALDAMPVKRLIAEELVNEEGEVCALGALGRFNGIDMTDIDPYNHDSLAVHFDIAEQLAAEVMWENDENGPWLGLKADDPEGRWRRVRSWAQNNLK